MLRQCYVKIEYIYVKSIYYVCIVYLVNKKSESIKTRFITKVAVVLMMKQLTKL